MINVKFRTPSGSLDQFDRFVDNRRRPVRPLPAVSHHMKILVEAGPLTRNSAGGRLITGRPHGALDELTEAVTAALSSGRLQPA